MSLLRVLVRHGSRRASDAAKAERGEVCGRGTDGFNAAHLAERVNARAVWQDILWLNYLELRVHSIHRQQLFFGLEHKLKRMWMAQ